MRSKAGVESSICANDISEHPAQSLPLQSDDKHTWKQVVDTLQGNSRTAFRLGMSPAEIS